MALALDIVAVDNEQQSFRKTGVITFSGSYSTGGDTLDLTAVTSDAKIPAAKFHRNPTFGRIDKGAIAGYVVEIVKSSSLTTWKIKVYESGADGGDLDEIAASSYPSAITDADVDMYVDFVEKAC